MANSFVKAVSTSGVSVVQLAVTLDDGSTAPRLAVGDIIVCHAGIDSPATVTFAKSSGTATIGSFATNTTQTGSVAQSALSWCKVTGTGLLVLKATFSLSTSVTFCVTVYRGAAGVGQIVTGKGNTGTDLSLNFTNRFANSWAVLGGCSEATAAALTSGTGTTVETSVQAVVVPGSANNISSALGSNESAIGAGVSTTLHFVQPTGKQWSAIMLELVNQFTAAGTETALASVSKVASSLKSVSESASAHATESVTSNNKSVVESASASASNVASSLKSVSESASASAAEVASSLKSVTENASASASLVASSVVAGSESASASAEVIASSLKSVTESASATAVLQVETNSVEVGESAFASAEVVASSVVSPSGQASGSSEVVASSIVAFSEGASATAEVTAGGGKSVSVTESATASVTVEAFPPLGSPRFGTGFRRARTVQDAEVDCPCIEIAVFVGVAEVEGENSLALAERIIAQFRRSVPPVVYVSPKPLPVFVPNRLPVVYRPIFSPAPVATKNATVTGEPVVLFVEGTPVQAIGTHEVRKTNVKGKAPSQDDADWVVAELLGMGELLGSPLAGFFNDGK